MKRHLQACKHRRGLKEDLRGQVAELEDMLALTDEIWEKLTDLHTRAEENDDINENRFVDYVGDACADMRMAYDRISAVVNRMKSVMPADE